MSLLTFFGTLRISEVVASGKGDMAKVVLQWQDVRVVDGMVRIHTRQSKADQQVRGVYIMLECCHMDNLCPVAATDAYLQIRDRPKDISLYTVMEYH